MQLYRVSFDMHYPSDIWEPPAHRDVVEGVVRGAMKDTGLETGGIDMEICCVLDEHCYRITLEKEPFASAFAVGTQMESLLPYLPRDKGTSLHGIGDRAFWKWTTSEMPQEFAANIAKHARAHGQNFTLRNPGFNKTIMALMQPFSGDIGYYTAMEILRGEYLETNMKFIERLQARNARAAELANTGRGRRNRHSSGVGWEKT